MNVLFVAPLPPPTTGHSIACEALHDEILARGHKVQLVNLSKPTFKHGVSSVGRIFEILDIARQVFRHAAAADLVYLTPAESIAGNLKDLLLYACLRGKLNRTYLHLHGGGGMKKLLSDAHPRLRKLNAWFIGRMAGVVVLGDRHRSVYRDIIAPDRIGIVKNFAPDETFAADTDFAAKWSGREGPLRLLFLSNLIPGKGYEYLLQAIDALDPAVRRMFAFDFAGGFESEDDKAAFLRDIARHPEIRYHGIALGPAKKNLLHAAHIFCLPSYYPEGQPVSILEAYAAGCSVITTDCGGIFDIFSPDANGFAVEPGSAASIAQTLTRLADARDRLKVQALNNMHAARSSFRREQHLQNLCASLGIR